MVFPFDYTARGIPLMDGTAAMPGYATAYNATANALDTALDEAVADERNRHSVEFVADLPVADNETGRLIYVEEDDRVRRWDGAQWGVIGFPPATQTTPTLGSGWATPSWNVITQRSGWVMLNFNAYRTSPGVKGTVICDVPVGYRGDYAVWETPTQFNLASASIGSVIVQYDTADEKVKLWEPMAADTSIALTIKWPLEGAV